MKLRQSKAVLNLFQTPKELSENRGIDDEGDKHLAVADQEEVVQDFVDDEGRVRDFLKEEVKKDKA